MDFLNVKKQKTNQLYMQAIDTYLDKMIPLVLEKGYQSQGIPNIKSVKSDITPSIGIYETLTYVYDTLMGFNVDLPISRTEGDELVNFKLSVLHRVEDMKRKMRMQNISKNSDLRDGR